MALLPDKQVKKKFKLEASQKPDDYYPTSFLKKEGFIRRKCKECGTYFWTINQQQFHCGDPSCSGGFKVISNNPSKKQLSYIDVWKEIISLLKPRGYEPVRRYPVVARWNPTADFVMASIAAFQPYVVSGEVNPPAKKLIIPQFSLRFGDVDNVGITGSHLTGFVMIGQHVFVDESEWSQEQLFRDIYEFLTISIGLPKNEITIHEDAWAGGGSFGPCMEFFSRGVELFNQVYTMFEQTEEGEKPLKLKVLDMGLGMERIAWFSQGTPNIYESTFPETLKKIKEITKIKMDHDLYKKFSTYSAFLNVDEVENIEETWDNVASKLDMSAEELRKKIEPMTAIYSIAEHSRALLVALNDGALPSNVGGGYNLRVIFRRAQSFIDQFGWDIDLSQVAEWHAEELKELFPELKNNISNVKKILEVEKNKHIASRDKASQIVKKIIEKDNITTEILLELYDSNGVSPEVIKQEAAKLGRNIDVPDNFYSLVSQLHEKKEQVHSTKKTIPITVPEYEKTDILYFDKHDLYEFDTEVKYIQGDNNQYIILDSTAFYPTSGGQMNDLGEIEGIKVKDVIKQGKVIIHVLSENPKDKIKQGQKVHCKIDKQRRDQLTKHHTATHIINLAARKILGNHVNQEGAKKTTEKATLDISHYESLTDDKIKEIEQEANRIVNNNLNIKKFFLPRDEAEKRYGLNIYQGGAIPGNELRIVTIGKQPENRNNNQDRNNKNQNNDFDVECCAGTHLNNTSETGKIKILKANKISDGIVRLSYVAGEQAEKDSENDKQILEKIVSLLSCKPNQTPERARELFTKWKKINKAKKKGKDIEQEWFILSSKEESNSGSERELLEETANILKTQPEHLENTITRFLNDIEKVKNSN